MSANIFNFKSISKKLMILLILGISGLISAQDTIKLSGRIFNAETGEGLEGANIFVEEINRGGVSDANGEFVLLDLPRGQFTISFSYIGFQLKKERIDTRIENVVHIAIGLEPVILSGQSIVVTATRAVEGETPVTFSNLPQKRIEENYTAADIPMILSELPNTYSYSHTGDNLGYSFLKIRGFDQKRVGVMINDIPLNDPEDHQVYWIDLPDLAESTEDIQVQRGIGNSIYGTSTFGGSVNIKTDNYASQLQSKVTLGGGSFNTRKLMAEFKSGMIQNTYAVYGRFSRITSDGFREYSSSNLLAYFLGFERYDLNMVTRLNIINGFERTHPDWDGIPRDILKTNRRYKKETYENAVDDFTQPQFQLINNWQISATLNLSNTLYYIRGEGYYENLKNGKKLRDYGMAEFETSDPTLFGADSLAYYETEPDGQLLRTADGNFMVERTDLVRQKWVKKNQYGWIGKLDFEMDDGMVTFGAAVYKFDSNHYGKVLWAKNLQARYNPDRKYYGYNGDRTNVSLYLNYLYDVFPNTKILLNLLNEYKKINFKQRQEGLYAGSELNRYELNYNFLSPRLGINHKISDRFNIYGNISYAQREPSDDDLYDLFTGPDDLGADPLFNKPDTVKVSGIAQYINWNDPIVEPETVLDYELGLRYMSETFSCALNLYYMDFSNEVVALGAVDKDGFPVKGNADKTLHMGLEFDVAGKLHSHLEIYANVAYSKNYFKKYLQNIITDWDTYEVGITDVSGNRIAGFPNLIGNFRMVGYWKNLSLSLAYKYIGKQFLDNSESENRRIDSFSKVDMTLNYRFMDILYFKQVRFIFNVINLLNEEYETAGYYDSWEGIAYYYPGAHRNYYFGITFSL